MQEKNKITAEEEFEAAYVAEMLTKITLKEKERLLYMLKGVVYVSEAAQSQTVPQAHTVAVI